jgi:nucleoside-diphosphate-sugar epimerase
VNQEPRGVLVTGANGFVAALLREHLASSGYHVVPAVRRVSGLLGEVIVDNVDATSSWKTAVARCEMVVHLAARVHVMHDTVVDPLDAFRRVNVAGTLNLAYQAAEAGVRRFVYLSSIKVNGERTESNQPFSADDSPAPQDAYAISKWEAEQGLRALAAETGMEVVIIRPPLVYGPGVKANFLAMLRWLYRGIPLPLGAIHNKRSLVGLGNLVDLIVTCLTHPAAVNQTFLVSDGEDLSTSELLRRTAAALGRSARLLPVPPTWLEAGASLIGKRAVAQRLLGSLQVDMGKTCALLGWAPPVTVDEELRRTAAYFVQRQIGLRGGS